MKKIICVLVGALALIACSPAFSVVPAIEQFTESVAHAADAVETAINTTVSKVEADVASTVESTLVGWVRERVNALLDGYPNVGAFLLLLTTSMPVLALLANKTANPTDDWILMLINKILQTVTYNTSTNQPNVLSWKDMLTHRPNDWPWLVQDKVLNETAGLRDKANILT